jgi:spore coat protein H
MRFASFVVGVVLLIESACAKQSGDSSAQQSAGTRSTKGGQATAANGRCKPTADTAWIEEGQSVTLQAKCATGLALGGSAFTVADLPSGATFDAATATLNWTPTLSQGGVYLIPVTALQLNETGTMKIGVADAFDKPGNTPVADPSTYTEEYGLPVLHLTVPSSIDKNAVDPTTGKREYVSAKVVYRGHTFTAEAKYRGNSSLTYPKKNYSLRFPEDDQFSEEVIADAVKSRRHLELITTFDDPSQVRYRMALALWHSMDPNNVYVRQFSLVLFLNGQYWGLYGASDKISASLFGHFGYSDAGNLYMGTDHDANFASFRYNEPKPQDETNQKTSLSEGWEKKDGTPAEGESGAFDDIVALTQFVISADDASFASQLPKLIDINDYYNWFILTTAIQAFDTLGKNTLHYHDPVANGPWRVTLWDFNECFGQRWNTARFPDSINPADIVYMSSGGYGYTNRDYLWRRFWSHPTMAADLRARYSSMLKGALSKEAVLALFDQMVAETAVSGKRDDRKWQTQYQAQFRSSRSKDFLDSAGEAAYVRTFIENRWAALLSLFP